MPHQPLITHVSDTAVNHVSDTAVNHVSDTAVNHASDTAVNHASDTAATHASDTAATHASDTAATHASDTAATHASDTAATHLSNTAAPHVSNTAGTRVSDSAVTHVPNAAVTHVSDTARWVAAHRAVESERPDALFEDPLADRLAGARGRAIAATAESSMSDNWFLVTRTKLIDDQVTAAIDQGCEVIVNLGAGLDTRPYRLPLPADLTWIETDLPDLIAEKETLLTDETPRCRLIRTALDVTDIVAVATLLDTIADRRALVLTEGLLMYLPEPAVAALSTTLHRPKVQWCLDFSTAGVANLMTNRNEDLLQRAPWIFLPPNGIAYFETQGWQTEYLDSIFTAAITFDRLPFPNAREALTGPQPDPRAPGDWPYSAVARLTY